MAGVAVKVTDAPEQTGLADAAMVTPTVNIGFTVMVTVFDVAGFPVVQVALEVITQVIALPFIGIYMKVEFVAPVIFVPFTLH